ncbi:alcohol dehydrogenase catalytic domain-containing protein [uncultured Friedmanniella sp.]|uniref:alcohol dehydrogenase catalytic domain-containing protein n=1 Tax=uncultured Friedmanniella sp. TaxID=335381 RepID=UPI0035CBC45A
MRGVYLPGNSTTELRELADPEPGPGQVLLAMRASTVCGSDIRAIYREHLQGDPAEMYQGVVAGHEPAGQVVAVGPGAVRIAVGDRVCLYHISGCGQCDDCVRGYQISCSSPRRAAYGWQRDGGHADLILAEERDCIVLPDVVTFLDGACVACGFGTAYEGLLRAAVSGRDALAVVGLGPVGLAAGLLGGKLGATPRVGFDPSPERRDLAVRLGAVDAAFAADRVDDARTALGGGAHVAIDCSGSEPGRGTAVAVTRARGRVVLVGEGNGMTVPEVSPTLIHPSITIIGSWVTSLEHMRELVERLPYWDLHPEVVVSDTFGLADAGAAYALADAGRSGKIALVP